MKILKAGGPRASLSQFKKAITEAGCSFDFVLPNFPNTNELETAGRCA